MATRRTPARKTPDDDARVRAILRALGELYPNPTTELDHRNAFELLVATILSAQCTDKRVNLVTPALFARFPDASSLAKADPAELESLIRTTGFYRAKTRSLLGASRALVERHGGQVPRAMDALVELPGVARKTANVVLGTAFGVADGVVVDTHVQRLSRRLALSGQDDPVGIERDLMAKVPRERWIAFGHQLILHGRRVCSARKPDCGHCALAPHCPSAFRA